MNFVYHKVIGILEKSVIIDDILPLLTEIRLADVAILQAVLGKISYLYLV